MTIEPASYRHLEGKDISDQEQVKRMLDRRNPVLSEVFMTVEGIEADDVEYPVTASDGSFLGAVSLLFSPEKLLTGVIFPAAAGETAEIFVMERGGRILFHPEKSRSGTNLLASGEFITDEKLRRLGERIAAEPEGKDLEANAAWTSVSLYDTYWRLAAFK